MMMLLRRASSSLDLEKSEASEQMETCCMALDPLLSVFMASCVPVILRPAHPLYFDIAHFLNNAPWFRTNDIPLFRSFFHSNDFMIAQDKRKWMTKVV